MTIEEFKNIWTIEDDSLRPISVERLTGLNLQQSTVDFLTISGFPENVAPYLTFSKDTGDIYDGVNKLTKPYDFLEKEFEKYIVIGTDGNGNTIAVNTSAGDTIEWLDFAARYFNNSVIDLAKMLLIYRDFVNDMQTENGEIAYLDSNFSDVHFSKLKQKLEGVDPKVLTENGFWKEELEMLLTNRADYLKGQEENSTPD
jgi:hypothetical protein